MFSRGFSINVSFYIIPVLAKAFLEAGRRFSYVFILRVVSTVWFDALPVVQYILVLAVDRTGDFVHIP